MVTFNLKFYYTELSEIAIFRNSVNAIILYGSLIHLSDNFMDVIFHLFTIKAKSTFYLPLTITHHVHIQNILAVKCALDLKMSKIFESTEL